MHDPIGFLAMRCTAFVEDQGLPHSDPLAVAVYDLVPAGGLPESCGRGAVGPGSGGVLLVFVAEEVPVVLWGGSYLALLCKKLKPKSESTFRNDMRT